MSPMVMAPSTVSTPFQALGADDQGADQLGIFGAIGEDAWLFIPFAVGFLFFSSDWGKLFERMMWRFYHATNFKEGAGLPSTLSARLASAFGGRAQKEPADSADPRGPDPERPSVEYIAVHNELSAIRSEILRERGSLSAA